MPDENFTYNDFVKSINVSRETFNRLGNYNALLKKWQKKINLISNNTSNDIWIRHITDSAQLIKYIEGDDKVIDIGSGAGLPGIILAILGVENITLVESDSRKVVFLKEAARAAEAKADIVCDRIENISLAPFNLITTRGFASVKDTLNILAPGLNTGHRLLLLKGKNCDTEINDARQNWSFDYKKFQSITEESGVVLQINNIKKQEVI